MCDANLGSCHVHKTYLDNFQLLYLCPCTSPGSLPHLQESVFLLLIMSPLFYSFIHLFISLSYKRNRVIVNFLCLTNFIEYNYLCPFSCKQHGNSFSLWLSNTPSCMHTTFSLSMHLLTGIEAVSRV